MDVIFEPQRGRPFSIEVGFFDTVLEIKEKIQKYQGIPIPRQTLVFNGQVLQDDRDVEYCVILHNSHIDLIIAPEPDKPQIKTEQSSPSKKINLNIKIPSTKTLVPLEMDINDTILRLKEKIHEMEPIPVNRLVLQSSGTELQDYRCLRDCELMDNSEIHVNIRPSPTGSGTGLAGPTMGSKKLKLMVLPKCGTKKIPVEVNASDNVGELRKELQKLHQKIHFHLPQEGYFFIYKQNVMDDDRSFRWHHVVQGDTIEIFNGSVTGIMENYDPNKNMQVIVESNGAKHCVVIPNNATVFDLKMRVLFLLGISLERQDLYHFGRNLQDVVKVQNYEIPPGDSIFLFLKICVWVFVRQVKYGLMVKDTAKVGELKEMLRVQFGLPIENKRLQFTNRTNSYLNDNLNMWANGVTHDTELMLV